MTGPKPTAATDGGHPQRQPLAAESAPGGSGVTPVQGRDTAPGAAIAASVACAFLFRRIAGMPGNPGEHDLSRRIRVFRGQIIVEAA